MEDRTKIGDMTNHVPLVGLPSVKTEENCNEWRERLMREWQLERPFAAIEPRIVSLITKKCRGIPYLCLDYFKQMLHSEFIL